MGRISFSEDTGKTLSRSRQWFAGKKDKADSEAVERCPRGLGTESTQDLSLVRTNLAHPPWTQHWRHLKVHPEHLSVPWQQQQGQHKGIHPGQDLLSRQETGASAFASLLIHRHR